MMIKKFKIVYFLISAFLLGVIYTLWVYQGVWSKMTIGLSKIPFYMVVVWFVFTFYLTLTLHELGHFFAFLFQGIKLRALYLTIFVFYKTKKGWKFTIKPKLWVLLGGLVVPDIGEINDEEGYQKVVKKFSISLMVAPIVTIVFLGVMWIIFLISLYTIANTNWIGWITLITLFTTLLSLLYIYTFRLSNQMFYGDFVAYKKMRQDEKFQLAQINQYTMFSLNESTLTQHFLWQKITIVAKKYDLTKNLIDMSILLSYIEGFIAFNETIDYELDIKINKLPVHYYLRDEQGLSILYEICHYYYLTDRIDQAYQLFHRISSQGSKKIKPEMIEYLKNRSMHVMHMEYQDAFLSDQKHIDLGQMWIFEPLIDLQKTMDEAHQKLPFKHYQSDWICYLEASYLLY